MTLRTGRSAITALMLGAATFLLAGCIISAPGTYPDPNGPRDGKDQLVDPKTGIPLPGYDNDPI